MKKHLITTIITLLLSPVFAQETIEITGKIRGLDNESMVLRYRFDGTIYSDTITAQNDVISFKKELKLPFPIMATFQYIGEDKDLLFNSTEFFISNDAPIEISGYFGDFYNLQAKNSPYFGDVAALRFESKDTYRDFLTYQRLSTKARNKLKQWDSTAVTISKTECTEQMDFAEAASYEKYDTLSPADTKTKLESDIKRYNERLMGYYEQLQAAEDAFILSYPNSEYAAYLYSTSLTGKSAEEVEKQYSQWTEKVQQSPYGQMVYTYMEAAKKVAPGAIAPAFTQKDINGKTVTLKQFKGKYVLLCFWGSWCGPCRRSHPHLMELVNKYQGKKFQAVGFASDRNKDKWKEAIEKDKLDFIHCNLFDKLNGEDVGTLYNIKSFPTKILIDPQGKIVGTVIGMGDDESKRLDEMLETALGK